MALNIVLHHANFRFALAHLIQVLLTQAQQAHAQHQMDKINFQLKRAIIFLVLILAFVTTSRPFD